MEFFYSITKELKDFVGYKIFLKYIFIWSKNKTSFYTNYRSSWKKDFSTLRYLSFRLPLVFFLLFFYRQDTQELLTCCWKDTFSGCLIANASRIRRQNPLTRIEGPWWCAAIKVCNSLMCSIIEVTCDWKLQVMAIAADAISTLTHQVWTKSLASKVFTSAMIALSGH